MNYYLIDIEKIRFNKDNTEISILREFYPELNLLFDKYNLSKDRKYLKKIDDYMKFNGIPRKLLFLNQNSDGELNVQEFKTGLELNIDKSILDKYRENNLDKVKKYIHSLNVNELLSIHDMMLYFSDISKGYEKIKTINSKIIYLKSN